MRFKFIRFFIRLLVLICFTSIFVPSLRVEAADQSVWGPHRESNREEQNLIDFYRKGGAPWSVQLDFHDRPAAEKLFEPFADDQKSLKSCRRPENIEINGALRLKTKKAINCHAPYSTGYVVSKNWHQLYGYFESRIRITNKSGINNAFWLTGKNLEIDIVEATFPKTIHWGLHDWGSKPPRSTGCHVFAERLTDQWHDYAILWLPDRIIYALNGKAVCTVVSSFAAVPVDIRYSTAVADFAGKIADPIGSEMDVAWLHVAPLARRVEK